MDQGTPAEILLQIPPTDKKEIANDDLKKVVTGGKKQVALNLIAYLCNMEPEAFRSYLKEARREHPVLARSWRHGSHLDPTQNE